MAVVEAPMAGKVLEIQVAVGDAIAEDDDVLVLEAMKMENEVFSTEAGTVKAVLVKVGDQVAEGQALIEVE
jgi:acetyl-CoA carboxylase biotin carboxyl carrier protein